MSDTCECIFHRYSTVYICGCGKLVSHSQADWDAHRLHPNGINIPSKRFKHGDNAASLFDRMHIEGLLPCGSDAYEAVCSALRQEAR